MGQKKCHQSAACQRERHSILAFWDLPCPLRSCGVALHVSTSMRWWTLPQVAWSRGQMAFFTLSKKEGSRCGKEGVLMCPYISDIKEKKCRYFQRAPLGSIQASEVFIQHWITSIDITQLCFPSHIITFNIQDLFLITPSFLMAFRHLW